MITGIVNAEFESSDRKPSFSGRERDRPKVISESHLVYQAMLNLPQHSPSQL